MCVYLIKDKKKMRKATLEVYVSKSKKTIGTICLAYHDYHTRHPRRFLANKCYCFR